MHNQTSFRNKSVNQSHFAMVPRSDVPRSVFSTDHGYKTAFNASKLVPVYLEEVLPGDTFNVSMTGFARMATPLFPVMDNFQMDSFFFFVPNRIIWDNWVRMMGEVTYPGATIDFTVPQLTFNTAPTVGSLHDYLGIPTAGQITAVPFNVSALPNRAYKRIYYEWFRDQNLIGSAGSQVTDDGPDTATHTEGPYTRGKRHDYFTSCLPWPQKGTAVSTPLGGLAPIQGIGFVNTTLGTAGQNAYETGGSLEAYGRGSYVTAATSSSATQAFIFEQDAATGFPLLYADLSQATSATINALRQAFQIQKLLERDARGGTRYVEILLSHFGVQPQDSRLQRPEYLGGGSTPVNINPIAQTSATGLEGGTSPIGSLGGVGTAVARHGFSYSATEHGFIIGLVNVRADLTYQQGLRRFWSRETRYEYYWPALAHLGEQAVLRKEIYFTGNAALDELVFGYQERWSEYRYHPSMITGIFRSSAANNIDEWHAAQYFTSAPTLNATFIEDNAPMERILAAGAQADGQEFLFDAIFTSKITRAMPTYSVPGFIDRF